MVFFRASYPHQQTQHRRQAADPSSAFTLIELLIVITIIGIAVVLSTFSVTVLDDFRLNEKSAQLLDEISQCREQAIYHNELCAVHIETPKTKRVIEQSSVGRTVLVGGIEFTDPLIAYQHKITPPTKDATFDIFHYPNTGDQELDLIYARNIDPSRQRDPLLRQGVVIFYPDASYSPFVLKLTMSKSDRAYFLFGDGQKLPELSDKNPLLSY